MIGLDLAEILRGFAAAQLRFLQTQEGRRTDPATQRNEQMSKQENLQTENLPSTVEGANTMSSALAKVEDGFEGFEDRVEDDDQVQTGGVIQGIMIKFSNEATWVTRDSEELPAGLELIAVDIARIVQKWIDQQPVETIVLAPGQKFPDVKKLNAEAPREEWSEGFDGKPRGPWQCQYITYLADPKTMEKFTYPTGTTGGGIAVRDLVEKTKLMRRYRGEHVYPVISLSDTFFPTRFGGRQRPHFKIVRWVLFGNEGKVLPAPAAPQTDLPTVEAPTLAEQMDDRIKY